MFPDKLLLNLKYTEDALLLSIDLRSAKLTASTNAILVSFIVMKKKLSTKI